MFTTVAISNIHFVVSGQDLLVVWNETDSSNSLLTDVSHSVCMLRS